MKSNLLILCASFAVIHLETKAQKAMINGCPPLSIKHGKVKPKGKNVVIFSCDKGYSRAGNMHSSCSNGRWESEPPVCVKPDCQLPEQLQNGISIPSHKGGVLFFYCEAEYVLEGPKQAYCVDTKWNTHLPSCLPTNTTPSLSCDFETDDVCGWSHDLNHNFDWTRKDSAIPNGYLATRPGHDHTKGTDAYGHYMYVQSATREINDTARLISPMYQNESKNTCLEFYYHMYGSGIGQLRVYVRKINDPWDFWLQDAVFIKDGNQGDEWWRGYVELGSIDDQFQVIFEGIRGSSFANDIAIDDVKIIENCITDNVVTNKQDVSEATFIYESCSGKCNTTTNKKNCGCDENCIENNSCCPDYLAICILDDDTDTADTAFDDSSTDLIEVTTILVTVPTTTKQPILPTTTEVIKTTNTPFLPQIVTTTPSKTIYKATLPPTVKLPIFSTKIPVSKEVPIEPITLPDIKTITPLTTAFNKTAIIKYFLYDMLTPPDEITTQDEVIMPITDAPETITKEYPTDDESDLPIISIKVTPIHEKPIPSNKTTVIAVLTVCFIVVGILLVIVLAKRYTSKSWMRMRMIRRGNGDSQSDVRYLTNDERLAFTISKPISDL